MRSLCLTLGLLLALRGLAAALGPDTSPWPMRSANGNHQSWTSQSGINKPKVSWVHTTAGAANPRNYMGVVVGSDQTIYVGGRSVFEALNPDGSVKWNPGLTCTDSWGTPAVDDSGHVFVSSASMVFSLATTNGAVNASQACWGQGGGYATLGGGGAITIDGGGHVFVSYGDETEVPAYYGGFGGQHSNVYGFTNTLSPYYNYIATGTAGTNGTGASFFTQLGELITPYTMNPASLARFTINTGSESDIGLTGTSQETMYGPVMESSIRSDDSFIVTEANSAQTACGAGTTAGGTNDYHLLAVNYQGATNTIAWRKCDAKWGSFGACSGGITGWCNHLSVPVSSNAATTYLLNNLDKNVYAISNSTGGTVWKYNVGALFPSVGNISPLTLTAGNNALYFSYCPTAGSTELTRLVSLNAQTGALNWDVGVSTTGCYAGQLVPSTGGRMYLYNGPDVLAFEESGVASVSFSSSPAAVSGNVWMSTVTASVVTASSGVPVEILSVNTSGAGISATTNGSASPGVAVNTNNSGASNFLVRWDLSSVAPTQFALATSSLVLAVPGLSNSNFYLNERRAASMSVSTTAAAIQGAVRFTTVTFRAFDAGLSPVQNLPFKYSAAGFNSATNYPTGPVWTTTSIGTATVVVGDDLTSLAHSAYQGYASTLTFAGLGLPVSTVVVSENRVATIQVSTNSPTVSGSLRFTTVTVRLADSLANPIAGVPMALDLLASPVAVTITPSQVGFTTATDASGTATFLVQENLLTLPHSSYATFSSSLTLHILSQTDSNVLLLDQRASTMTVSISTPSIEDTGSSVVRVTTVTVTVFNSTGGVVAGVPIGLDETGCAGTCSVSPSGNFALTNSTGQAVFVHRMQFAGGAGPVPFSQVPAYSALVNAYTLSLASVTAETADTRITTFTVTFSTPVIQTDLRSTTMTITVTSGGLPVPNAIVDVQEYIFSSTGPALITFKSYGGSGSVMTASNNTITGYTDSNGQAVFPIALWNGGGFGNEFDTFSDFIDTLSVAALRVPSSSQVAVNIESNYLDHYVVTVPTISAVGVSFTSTVTAQNIYNHTLAKYNETTVTLVPLFSGTNVQGTGTLGTPQISFAGSGGQVVISSQNYNRIEDIQVKAVRGSGVTKTGLSGNLHITGPDHFSISIPTGASAGQVFIATITAVDTSGNRVVGYSGTLALSATLAVDTSAAAGGSLGVTSVNMPANGQVAISNESYNKGGGIRIKAFDSASNIAGYSSSMTVTQPPMTIDHYGFQFPSAVSVGVPFRLEIDALNASSAPVTYSLDRTVNLQAFIAGTNFGVAGSGSLGNSNVTIVAGSTYAVVAAQTYNRIETIQLKGTDQDGIVGSSTFTLAVNGPNHFDTAMATAAQAGQNFQLTVIARDASNNQVLGYNGTVSLAAVQASATSLSGGGVLGVTNLNVSGGQVTTAFQSYTKAEGIRLRISDSGIGVTSYSSSMTVTPGPPASLSILANPQSTVAGVASVLTGAVLDNYSNVVAGSTVTFQLLTGSGTLAIGIAGLPSAVTSTDAVANSAGVAQAFFASTNTLSAQADVLRARVGSLLADTTVYNAVLIGPAGGTIVNFNDPNTKAIVPANAYGTNVRLALNEGGELAASDVAIATAAMAKSPNTFVSTFTAKISAVLDSNPNVSAGNASQPVTVQFPFTADASSNVQVGAYPSGSLRTASLLVPFSVMRVFKLNQATSVFEMVLDGTNLPSIGSRSVSAQVTDPNGIYALGAPPFTSVSAGSSATVTTTLASGATATVTVPFGAFATPVVLQVGVPSAASVPAIPGAGGVTGTGITISVGAGGVQPVGGVDVTIGYTAGGIGGADPDNLRLARYDPDTGWLVLDSQVDTVARTVTGQTNHFSLFQIVSVAAAADVSSGYAFPNPFRPSQGHTTIGFANLPASAHVEIFSVSGRLLKELDADTTGRVTGWNADDSSGRPLASGVYIAVFVNGRDKKTFKFAVQR